MEDKQKNKRTLWRIVALIFVFWIIVGAFLGPKVFRKLGASWYVEACRERGGCWNVREGRCESGDSALCAPAEPSPKTSEPVP